MPDHPTRFYARSASDRTDDWPLWFIADRQNGDLNVTARIVPQLRGRMPFLPREVAEAAAAHANRALAGASGQGAAHA